MDESPNLTAIENDSTRKPQRRSRIRMLIVPLALIGGLLWVTNWFYQRSRLFQDSYVVLGVPYLPWGKLIGEDTARELFGMPVELNPHQKDLTSYQVGLIGGYHSLKTLQLRGMTDADISQLKDLENLTLLQLSHSPITDEACEVIGQLPNLTFLEITSHGNSQSDAPVAQITDDGLKALAGLRQLTRLYLQSAGITDEGLKYIGQMNTLNRVVLYDAQIRGEHLEELAALPMLEALGLDNCPLEGNCLAKLKESLTLRMFELDGSTITDEMLPSLIPIRSLTTVILRNTQVTEEGCRALLDARPDLVIWDANDRRVRP